MVTGTLIAASTLGILFTLSASLRRGLFELDGILKKRRQVEMELKTVSAEKERVSQELSKAKERQTEISRQLATTNRYFQQAKRQLSEISTQAGNLRTEVKKLSTERQSLLAQQTRLRKQSQKLQETTLALKKQLGQQNQKLAAKQQEVVQQDYILQEKETRLQQLQERQNVLQKQIDQQDQFIAQLDRQIASKDGEIASKDSQLQAKEQQRKQLEQQFNYLKDEVEILEQYYQNYQDLRARQIALVRGQVLAFAAVRVVDPKATTTAIDRLLTEANLRAIEATQSKDYSTDTRLVKITKAQVEQLSNQIKDGKDYVVRIISAGNYVQGEEQIRVFADVAINRQIFRKGQEIATVSVDATSVGGEINMQQRLDLLLSAAQFRARSAGILGDIQVENGDILVLINFLNSLKSFPESIEEIEAVAAETTPTVGPLKLRLYALKNGRILFSTQTNES
jgi:uncharacterized protein (DUF3084 family)